MTCTLAVATSLRAWARSISGRVPISTNPWICARCRSWFFERILRDAEQRLLCARPEERGARVEQRLQLGGALVLALPFGRGLCGAPP